MLRVLLKISIFIDNLSERIGVVSEWLVIVAVAIAFYNVVMRRLAKYIGVQLSSNLFIEMQWYLFSLVFFLSFAYILKNGINVRVDFIYATGAGNAKPAGLLGTSAATPSLLCNRRLGFHQSGDDLLAAVGAVT